jgi:hypothetical protein
MLAVSPEIIMHFRLPPVLIRLPGGSARAAGGALNAAQQEKLAAKQRVEALLAALPPAPPAPPAAGGAAGHDPGPGLGRSPGLLASFDAAAEDSPPPFPRTKWTRRVPHPVLIGHAASL